MTYMFVSSKLDDYETWKAQFDAYTPAREDHGCTDYEIYRVAEDPRRVLVMLEFDGLEDARAWNDYISAEFDDPETGMANTTVEFLDLAERSSREPVSAP